MNVDIQLTPHFKLAEFLYNHSAEGVTVDVLENLRKLAQALETVRKRLGGKAISINSGFRTPQHNAAVGGVSDSLHLLGMAADIEVAGMTPAAVQTAMRDWNGGMGCYKDFTHLDIGRKRRWVL